MASRHLLTLGLTTKQTSERTKHLLMLGLGDFTVTVPTTASTGRRQEVRRFRGSLMSRR